MAEAAEAAAEVGADQVGGNPTAAVPRGGIEHGVHRNGYGIESPIEQSRRHETVLKRILGCVAITGLLGTKPTQGNRTVENVMCQKTPDGEWIDTVTEMLSVSLKCAARASYENGCALLDDARVLYAAVRFPRASALAILAEEEFSKAFIVCSAVQQKRWDSSLFRGLRDHAPKQAVAQGMLIYWEWAKQNAQRVADMNNRIYSYYTPSYIPPETQMTGMLSDLKKSHIKKRQRDKEKQSYLYVGIDRSGKVANDPRSTSEGEATNQIEHAVQFREIAEHMLAHTLTDFIPLGESAV